MDGTVAAPAGGRVQRRAFLCRPVDIGAVAQQQLQGAGLVGHQCGISSMPETVYQQLLQLTPIQWHSLSPTLSSGMAGIQAPAVRLAARQLQLDTGGPTHL